MRSVPSPAASRLRRRWRWAVAGVGTVAVLLAGCGSSSTSPAASGTRSPGSMVRVVAAEDVWGSIASQIGGRHVQVTSIITNPNSDPHSYEPTTADARALAGAQLVIENGIGYDPWVPKLLAADASQAPVLDVGKVVGVPVGGNPHRWYNPADVQAVIRRLVQDYQQVDPTDASYFTRQASRFDTADLAAYNSAIAAIRAKYAGTPVGASESIVAMLAPALGLRLITPPTFLKAISEGTDASVADTETIDRQIKGHAIKIYIYNSQNVTPDVRAQLVEVGAEHIPRAVITETLVPAGATYQAWQTRQLLGIEAALARAGPR